MEANVGPSRQVPKRLREHEQPQDNLEHVEMSDLYDLGHESPLEISGSSPSPVQPDSKRRKVTIEEVEDVDAPGRSTDEEGGSEVGEEFEFIEDFPKEAGTPGRRKKTPFEKLQKSQSEGNKEPFTPFADNEEWELAHLPKQMGLILLAFSTALRLILSGTF
jgi:hypothetical protein